MTVENETLYTHNGIQIIKTTNRLHGLPRIEGTRMDAHHIGKLHEEGVTIRELQSSKYFPHLTKTEIKTAIKYYQQNPHQQNQIEKYKQMKDNVLKNARETLVCKCGVEFLGVDNFKNHTEIEEDKHIIIDHYYDTDKIICKCGTVFYDPFEFCTHIGNWGTWDGTQHAVKQIVRGEPTE